MPPQAFLHGASRRLSDSLNANSREYVNYVWSWSINSIPLADDWLIEPLELSKLSKIETNAAGYPRESSLLCSVLDHPVDANRQPGSLGDWGRHGDNQLQ